MFALYKNVPSGPTFVGSSYSPFAELPIEIVPSARIERGAPATTSIPESAQGRVPGTHSDSAVVAAPVPAACSAPGSETDHCTFETGVTQPAAVGSRSAQAIISLCKMRCRRTLSGRLGLRRRGVCTLFSGSIRGSVEPMIIRKRSNSRMRRRRTAALFAEKIGNGTSELPPDRSANEMALPVLCQPDRQIATLSSCDRTVSPVRIVTVGARSAAIGPVHGLQRQPDATDLTRIRNARC